MASIEIKNIGPLVDTGKIELKFINLFIGKQSTGKSTLMKILSFCCWLEKKIMTEGEEILSQYTHYMRFKKELIQFHRFSDNFFSVFDKRFSYLIVAIKEIIGDGGQSHLFEHECYGL